MASFYLLFLFYFRNVTMGGTRGRLISYINNISKAFSIIGKLKGKHFYVKWSNTRRYSMYKVLFPTAATTSYLILSHASGVFIINYFIVTINNLSWVIFYNNFFFTYNFINIIFYMHYFIFTVLKCSRQFYQVHFFVVQIFNQLENV